MVDKQVEHSTSSESSPCPVGGDYNLYVYEAPVGTQAAPLVGTDLWNIPSDNNTIAMAGVDHDGDRVDEIAVMKNE